MPNIRLHIDQPLKPNSDIEIRGERAHYAGRVLRLRTDDVVALFDGTGGEFEGRVLTVRKKVVELSVGAHVNKNVESNLSIHLLQGVSRGERMDMVMQKATELGVDRITPLVTDYSVVKLTDSRVEKRQQRWQSISISACEQCGRNVPPTLDAPASFHDWMSVNDAADSTRLILHPGGISSLKSARISANPLVVLIGPEGGFSETEYQRATSAGFQNINIGPRILRTETAAVAVLAVLQAMYGDLANSA